MYQEAPKNRGMNKNGRYCSVGNSKGNAGAVRDRGAARKKTAKTKARPQKAGRGVQRLRTLATIMCFSQTRRGSYGDTDHPGRELQCCALVN